MAKKAGAKDNFRIVVEPRSVTNFGYVSASRGLLYGYGPEAQARWERDMQERCDELIADMKRHVDNFGRAFVEFDQEHVCEHCGSTWTETSSAYNGGCCEADQEAEDARLANTGEQA
jgi:rubrerythrin